MKKIFKGVAVLAAMAAMGTGVAFAAGCDSAETYKGEYKYESEWVKGNYYGCQVEVTVKGGKITKVVQTNENTDAYTNITAKWDADGSKASGFQAWVDSVFVGKTVTEVKGWKVDVKDNGEPVTLKDGQKLDSGLIYTGATQTTGRTILAVQNALKDVK